MEVNAALETESSEILKQRGQLEREAMSITEQMSVEAQVCCVWLECHTRSATIFHKTTFADTCILS